MAFDSLLQRQIMGRFATGVTVASTAVDGKTWGMTASAVASLSLEPPLVLLAVTRNRESHDWFQRSGCYALNILSVSQQHLSDRFAFTGPKDFSGLEYFTAQTGAPILPDVLGWVDCRLREILPGGDHDIFVGEIVAGAFTDETEPLLYFRGRYRRMAVEE